MTITNDKFVFTAEDVNLLSAGTQRALRLYFGDRTNVRQGLAALLNNAVDAANTAQLERVKAKYDRLDPATRAQVAALLNGAIPDPA